MSRLTLRDLGFLAATATVIVTDGLVLHLDAGNPNSYPGSGTTWTDLSGNGNNGTLTNGPTYSSSNGGSIVFDGINDFAEIANPTALQNQSFSISIWARPGTQDASIISIIDFDHDSKQGWVLQSEDATSNRYYYLAWHDGSNFQPSGSFGSGKGIQLTTSSWQNVVFCKSGTSLIGYLNGNQVYSATASNGNVAYINGIKVRICSGFVLTTGREFTGNISSVKIYSKALTATEVTQNFNALRGRYGL